MQMTDGDRARLPGATAAYAAAPTPAAAKGGSWFKPWMGYLGAGLVGLFVGIGVGGANGSQGSGDASAAGTPTVTVSAQSTVTAGPTPTATVTKTATVTAAPPKPKAAISDGVWVVGEDIAAGKYKVIDAIEGEGCYWSITKSGTNGDTIIANDLPSGGRPVVTLKKGQDFNTEGCGDWAKQ